jgi:hypothetical protein
VAAAWAADNNRRPADLAPRVTFLATPPINSGSAPDCDFAVPFR